jgi:hypothetical protein
MFAEPDIFKFIKLNFKVNPGRFRFSSDVFEKYHRNAFGNVSTDPLYSVDDVELIGLLSGAALEPLSSKEQTKKYTMAELAILLIANIEKAEYILQHIDLLESQDDVKVIPYLIKNYPSVFFALYEHNNYIKGLFVRPSAVANLLSQEPLSAQYRNTVIDLHIKTTPAYLSEASKRKALKKALNVHEGYDAIITLAQLLMDDEETIAEAFSMFCAIPSSSSFYPLARERMLLIAKACDRDQSRVISYALEIYFHPASTAEMKEFGKINAWHGLISLGYMGTEANISWEFDEKLFTQCSNKFLQETQASICKLELKGLASNRL